MGNYNKLHQELQQEKEPGMCDPTLFQTERKKLIIKRNSMNNALALLYWERVGQGETRKPLPHKNE